MEMVQVTAESHHKIIKLLSNLQSYREPAKYTTFDSSC